jgi:cytoskeletal protein CcmA (bactofilin family)
VAGILWGIGLTFAVAVALVAAVTWLAGLFPAATDWLNPLNRTALLNLLFRSLLYFAQEGPSMLHLIIVTVSYAGLAAVVVGGLYFLARRSISTAVLAALTLVLVFPRSASALEKRTGATVNVLQAETVEGTLLASGETTNIDGVIDGDLISFSRRVVIRGTVKGDVICFNQTLEIDGTVGGNVYTFAQAFEVRGSVTRSVYAWVQALHLNLSGRVDRDVVAGAAEVALEGNVGRDVALGAGSAELRGSIGRDVRAYVGNLSVVAPAKIGGNLIAHVDKTEHAHIDPGATIAGKVEIRLPEKGPSRYTRPMFYFWQAVRLAAALLTGLVLFWLFPSWLAGRMGDARTALRAAGIGFLVLVATPVGALIAGITLVGLPIALMGLVLWIAGLYLAKIFVAAAIGDALVRPPAAQWSSFALALLLGLLIVFVCINLPYLGGWIGALITVLGLGLAFTRALRRWRPPQPAA